MAKQHPTPVFANVILGGAASPKVRTTCGVNLHDADGTIEHASRLMGAEDIFWGYGVQGALLFSVGRDLVFRLISGNVISRRFVPNRGWHDSTNVVKAELAGPSLRLRRPWIRAFVSNLFSPHELVEWIEATQRPYAFLELDTTGTVMVLGAPMQVGDLPVPLPNGWVISRPGSCQVHIADAHGVFNRFRHVAGKWLWLAKCHRVPWSALEPGLTRTANGELAFTARGIPSLIIGAGKQFTVHLADDRTLVRSDPDGPIYVVSVGAQQILEYVYKGNQLWQQEGARDQWSYELLGVPGYDGEKPVLFKEVVPGAIVYANGKFEAINRTYLLGEEINLQCGGVSIERARGCGEAVFISANGSTVGYFYSLLGDWFKMTPVAPDQRFFTWRRCFKQQNIVDAWVRYVDSIIDDTPGIHALVVGWAAVWRFVKAAADEPCLAPFGLVIFILYFGLQVTRALLLTVTVPMNLVWRMVRQVRRAYQLTK